MAGHTAPRRQDQRRRESRVANVSRLNERGTPEHQLAVLTVLAYYFERCDIFEEPLENTL